MGSKAWLQQPSVQHIVCHVLKLLLKTSENMGMLSWQVCRRVFAAAGDGFLRSSVLSDLLEVNRLLQQLRPLHGPATLEQLLQKLVDAAAANAQQAMMHTNQSGRAAGQARPSTLTAADVETRDALDAACSRLSAQLRSCIEYLHGFKALYNRLANRAEFTREIVVSVMNKGVYHFGTAPLAAGRPGAGTLPCANSGRYMVVACCHYSVINAAPSGVQPSSSAAAEDVPCTRQLGLSELDELCSRVMLMANTTNHHLAGVPGTGIESQPTAGSAAATGVFGVLVREVSTAKEVAAALQQLLNLGCFSYISWEQQLSATADPQQRHGLMQQLLEQLQQDLQAWKHKLASAQARCLWLNYFEPQQLFSLSELAGSDCGRVTTTEDIVSPSPATIPTTAETQPSAVALLQFARSDLQQQHLDAVMAAEAALATSTTADGMVESAGSHAVVAAARTLQQLASRLNQLFAKHSAAAEPEAQASQQAAAAAAPTALPDIGHNSRIKVVIRDNTASSLGLLLQVHTACSRTRLQPSQVVFCSGSTSWWPVQLLLQRCFPWLAWHAAGLGSGDSHEEDGCLVVDHSAANRQGCKQQEEEQQGISTMHVLCDVNNLSLELQNKLLQLLHLVTTDVGTSSTSQLLLISNSSCLVTNSLLQATTAAPEEELQAAGSVSSVDKVQIAYDASEVAAIMHQLLQQQACSVTVLTSDLPGQGKSTTASRLAAAQDKPLYHVLLVDSMLPPCDLMSQLRGWDPQQHLLHLHVLSCSTPSDIERSLFSLLALGHLSEGGSVYHRSPEPCSVVIEVGDSLGGTMLQQMPLLAAASQQHGVQLQTSSSGTAADGCSGLVQPGYRRLHCSFSLDAIDTSTADMQLVCTYLALAEPGVLDQASVGPSCEVEQQYQQYMPSPAACRQLLLRAFIAGREAAMSYTMLNTFVAVAARQLRHMSSSCYFMPETLQYAFSGARCSVRSQLLQAITTAAASFAVESCSAVRNSQHHQQQATRNAADAGLQLAARMSSVISWADSNHLLLLFNTADDHQTITPVYRSAQHVPASFQQLLATQVLRSQGREGGLTDYTALSHYQLLPVLLQLVQPPNSCDVHDSSSWDASLVSSPYILTPDNLLKMSLIHLRAQCGLPIVMMGDAGCGKTSLLKFLAEAAAVKLHVVNVHAGTTGLEILQAVAMAGVTAAKQSVKQVGGGQAVS